MLDADGTTFRLYYTGYEADATGHYACMATSTDNMVTWDKPDLGLVTFGGNTNNNILIELDSLGEGKSRVNITDIIFAENQYHMVIFDAQTNKDFIYSSDAGEVFNFVKFVFSSGTHAAAGYEPHIEAKGLLFSEGKYMLYYSIHQLAGVDQRRSIGYYEWYPMASGLPVNRGLIEDFKAQSEAYQFYDFLPWEYAGSIWGCTAIYNHGTVEELGPLLLYRNDKGGVGTGAGSWTLIGTLIELGADTEWDDTMVTVGKPILVSGVWYMFYSGSTEKHNSGWPSRNNDLGLATATI